MVIGWTQVFELINPLADAVLLLILLVRGRVSRFRAFAAFVLADLIVNAILDIIYSRVSAGSYRDIYLCVDLLIFGLQIWVIFELLRSVLKPAGSLSPSARSRFLIYGLVGAAAALFAAFLLQPQHISGMALTLFRLEVFGDLLMTEAVIAILLTSGNFGLHLTSHVLAIGQGMMALALITVAVDGVGLCIPTTSAFFQDAYYARSILYLATVLYWSIALWREEPERKPISPALRKYIVALHDQVQYDLGKVRH